MRKRAWRLISLILLLNLVLTLRAELVSVNPYFQFSAVHGDYCGYGGARFYGYQSPGGGTYWTVHGNIPPDGGPFPGDYLTFSWTLTDEVGQLASGSWDSITGTSTGGTYGTDFDFTTSRLPNGEMYFEAFGSYRNFGCGQVFQATSATGVASHGAFYSSLPDTTSTYVFRSQDSGLVLQMPDATSSDYEVPVQDYYNEEDYQHWSLTSMPGCGPFSWYGCYRFNNSATALPLFSDYGASNSLIYQLSGTNLTWRFISAGDGSWYIAYDQYIGGPPPTYASYSMGPVAGSPNPGISIEAYPRPFQQSQKWLILRVE